MVYLIGRLISLIDNFLNGELPSFQPVRQSVWARHSGNTYTVNGSFPLLRWRRRRRMTSQRNRFDFFRYIMRPSLSPRTAIWQSCLKKRFCQPFWDTSPSLACLQQHSCAVCWYQIVKPFLQQDLSVCNLPRFKETAALFDEWKEWRFFIGKLLGCLSSIISTEWS